MKGFGAILALDQGGGSSRALIFDSRGRLLGQARRPVGHHRPAEDRVEQDPEELVASLDEALTEVLAERSPDQRPAIAGLATQRSSLVCWQRDTGRALSPVLSWQDRRAAAELEALDLDRDRVRAVTGLLPSPHYGASKMRWCLDHLAEVQRARREDRLVIGPLASFLAFRLCAAGPIAADPSNAQRTLLFDIDRRDWSPALLERFELPRHLLPEPRPSDGSWGRLLKAPGVDLRLVTGDQGAALFANGEPQTESIYINLGTGAFLQRPVTGISSPTPDGLLTGIVVERLGQSVRVIEGTVNGAASALDWIGQELAIERPAHRLAETWKRVGTESEEPPRFPLFLNGVSGLGSPYWRSDFPTAFVDDAEASADSRLVAVAESILFLIAVNLERMRTLGPEPRRLVVTGGLSRIDRLCQALADLSRLPIERPDETEATARGTAWLAADGPEDWEVSAKDHFTPTLDHGLDRRFERWQKLMAEQLAD